MRLLIALALVGCSDDDGVQQREPTTRLVETDLGELVAAPFTEPREIDVPEGALSLTVVAQSDLSGIVSLEIEAPDGTLLTDALAPIDSLNPVYAWTRVTVAQVPMRPEVTLASGRYRVRGYYDGVKAVLSMRAFAKLPLDDNVDVDADGQTLALTLFYATSSVGPGDDDLDLAVEAATDIWAGADVEIQRAGEHELGDVGVVTESGPELDSLLQRSAGLAPDALPTFVVEDLRTKQAKSVAGLAAIVPLPPIDGTPRSGILLSTASLRDFPDLTGQILAHEIGHALGLVHTTEQDGVTSDPLSDTPECLLDRDSDGDDVVEIGECSDRGATNLMFWACCASRDPSLSEDQRFVVLRSALTR